MWSVFFVFLSYLDRNFVRGQFLSHSLDAEKETSEIFYMLNSTFCAKSSYIGGNYLHQVSDGAEEIRSVYDAAGKLVDCSVTHSEMEVKSFMHVCRLGLKDKRVKPNDSEKSSADVAQAKSNCQAFQRKPKRTRSATKAPTQRPGTEKNENSSGETRQALRRSKRGFTYPGTLWCGAGNIADHYDHLGEFAETDKCCRVHDHCPYVIHAFSSNFGYTNFKWHSISHCDCDNALKECLRAVNDTSSRVIGQAFFNVIEVPCFEFSQEEQCVERHWYGLCKKYEKVPVAVLKESIAYDFGGVDIIDELTIAPPAHRVPKTDSDEGDKAGGAGKAPPSGSQAPPPGSQAPPPGSQATAHEEPSIGNVVTAAEDFIKVLATVSTSHSTSTEAAKGDAQGGGKKKKKKLGKKKNKQRKGKGKGRKKQAVSTISSRMEKAVAIAPPSTRPEEVINNSLPNNPSRFYQTFDKNVNHFLDPTLELENKELSNEVMKDEPQRSRDDSPGITASSLAISPRVKAKMDHHETQQHREKGLLLTTGTTTAVTPQPTRSQKSAKRQGRKKTRKTPPNPSMLGLTFNGASNDEPQRMAGDRMATATGSPAAGIAGQFEPAQLAENAARGLPVTATRASDIKPLKTKRQKSNTRRGRKKRRKVTPTSTLGMPLDAYKDGPQRPEGDVTGITTTSPTVEIKTPGVLDAQGSETHTEKGFLPTTASPHTENFLKTKRRKSNERKGQKRRRKTLPTPPTPVVTV